MRLRLLIQKFSLILLSCVASDRLRTQRQRARSVRPMVVWMCPMQLDRPVLDSLADEFRQANPDIDLRLDWVPTAQYGTKLKTLIAAHQAPDLFYCGDVWVAYLLPFLADLSDYYKQDAKEIDLDDIYPDVRLACQWKGRDFYVPRFFNVSLLYYNRRLFDQAGVAYPTSDWTWKEYLSAAQKLTRRDANNRVEIWGTSIITGWWGEWLMLVRQSGGELFNSELTQCELSSPAALQAMHFYDDLVHRYHVAPAPGMGPDQNFASGKMAMELGGHTGNWNVYRQVLGDDWDIELLPGGPLTRNGGEISMEGIGLSKDSRVKPQAWRFLKFMLSRHAIRAQVDRGYLSIRRSVAEDTFLRPGSKSSPHNVRAAYEAIRYARSIPRSPDFIEVTMEVIQPEIDRMLGEGVGVELACRRATAAANEFLTTLGSQRREDARASR